MGQKKGRKNNPKPQAKGKPKEVTNFNAQLSQIGLKVVDITADGNCLFRAVADQLEGNEEEHLKYRNMVVDFIESHREEYEPFIEDDVPFDEYCKNMREPTTWAGHMELQAISLVTHTNICIHRQSSPRWHIVNFTDTEARCIDLSYHNGEHYNSIRKIDDNGEGPAKPIRLEGPEYKAISDKEKAGKQKRSNNKKLTKNHDNFSEETHVEVYEQDYNDAGEDNNDQLPLQETTNANNSDVKHETDQNLKSSCTKSKGDDQNTGEGTVRAARNKACPCGSKKKYKACCGAAKPQIRHHETASPTEGLSNKARKQKLRNSKEKPKLEAVSKASKDELDLGYLCI